MIDKILSWNVRGLNDSRKKNMIRGSLNWWKPIIVCFQETKLDSINEKTIKCLWRMEEVGWHFLLAKGSAVGILLMWRKEGVVCLDVIFGETT